MASSFEDMPTLGSSSPSSPPSSSRNLRKSYARRAERCCFQTFGYIPLCFVYGLTTWAVWVAVNVAFYGFESSFLAYIKAAIAFALYALADSSYTIAVFSGPGSPLDERVDLSLKRAKGSRGAYEGLPTSERDDTGPQHLEVANGPMTTVTAKSTGHPRYCKKCNSIKPDRAHHCSTCGRCVLKMDHHCPWLATCVGLRNYKAFMLFLIYTSLFCWVCFALSSSWVWYEIVNERQIQEGFRIVNTIILAVISGIIGLALSGFTGWHIYLTLSGQTTIESLEKTRYLAPVKKSMEHQLNANRTWLSDDATSPPQEQSIGDQIKEIHANALPGILRPEEGEVNLRTSKNTSPSPSQSRSSAKDHLQQSYASIEARREHERYAAYLDELDSEKLPNAFNLGWRRNVTHVFGHQPLLWFFPVLNTSGDGWQWEISPAWLSARDDIARQREAQNRQQQFAGPSARPAPGFRWQPGQGFVRPNEPIPPPPRVNGYTDSREMQPLDRRKSSEEYETSSDEDGRQSRGGATANWNDVPEEYLGPSRSRAPTRNPGHSKGKDD